MTLPARIGVTLGLALIVELIGQAIFRAAIANAFIPTPASLILVSSVHFLIPDIVVLAFATGAYWLVLRFGIGNAYEARTTSGEFAARATLISPAAAVVAGGFMATLSLPTGGLLRQSLASPSILGPLTMYVSTDDAAAFHGTLAAIGLTLAFCYALIRGKSIPPARAAAMTFGTVIVSIFSAFVSM